MRHVWSFGGSAALTAAGGVLAKYGWVPGVLWLLVSLWCVVYKTRVRAELDRAASDRKDWLAIILPALDPETQKVVARTVSTPGDAPGPGSASRDSTPTAVDDEGA